MLTESRKASQRLTEKGVGTVTNPHTRGGKHNKNYLSSDLKGQWCAAGRAAKGLREEHGIAGWKAGGKQLHLREALGKGGACSNLGNC